MRVSEMLIPTLRETPAEAEIISHKLLLRAGFIRKTATGIYTYLPLGLRVIKKIMAIVHQEMNQQGGQEILMPIMQPAELWLESGRWHVYGPELMRLKDRHQRDFCLGPTHEEVITSLISSEIKSYKQLPQLLYQIANKYRDEQRPRFGLMRGREFIMKDLYSFDVDQEALNQSYQKMYQAYMNIFNRCGLDFRAVEADPGAIGGDATHEFMVLAESGEATVLYCAVCDYAANSEKVPAVTEVGRQKSEVGRKEDQLKITEVATPGAHTVEQVTKCLDVKPALLIKTLIYKTDQEVIAALVRGDRELNEIKLYNILKCLTLELADAATVRQVTAAPVGYAGPVNLQNMRLVVDEEVAEMVNAVTGANKKDTHLINVNPGRDFPVDSVADIRVVTAGEYCPKCAGELLQAKGIEVGQVFKLGDKYSKLLKATFLDQQGKAKPLMMGCYGIGVSRTMAAAVEQNHDQNGIIWPVNIAPFEVVVIPVNAKDDQQFKLATDIYHQLIDNGIETIMDDRLERAGVKFKDADLIGYPLRVVIGKKTIAEQLVEVHNRRTSTTENIAMDDVVSNVAATLQVCPETNNE
ncbi:proline--tRNA ligase [Peptococcaceae bacterium]|nr:proline--tRNA ligase [Peptococcaceae bacterium]